MANITDTISAMTDDQIQKLMSRLENGSPMWLRLHQEQTHRSGRAHAASQPWGNSSRVQALHRYQDMEKRRMDAATMSDVNIEGLKSLIN